MMDHQRHEAGVMCLLSLHGMFGNESLPRGIDLSGLRENLKECTGRGYLGICPLWCVAKAIRHGRATTDDVHFIKALRCNGEALLVSHGEESEGVKCWLSMWMTGLGNSEGDIGVNEDHQSFPSTHFHGCHPQGAIRSHGCRPRPEAT